MTLESLLNCVNMEPLSGSTDGFQRKRMTAVFAQVFLCEQTPAEVLTRGAGRGDSGKTGQCVSFNRQYLYSLSGGPCFFPKHLLWKNHGPWTSPHLFSDNSISERRAARTRLVLDHCLAAILWVFYWELWCTLKILTQVICSYDFWTCRVDGALKIPT